MSRAEKSKAGRCLFLLLCCLTLWLPGLARAEVLPGELPSAGGEYGISYRIGADAPTPGRRVRVGFCNLPYFQEMDINGKRSGYTYELLQLLNLYSDWSYAYDCYESSWQATLQKLEAGEIDMIAMAEKTAEREERFLFSDVPVRQQREVLVTRKGNTRLEMGKPEQLAGIKVGTVRGTLEGKSFQRYASLHGVQFELVVLDNPNDAREALIDGDIDAMVKGTLALEPHEKLLAELSSKPCYIMLNKDAVDLKREVDAALKSLERFYPAWQAELNEHYAAPAGTETLRLYPKDLKYLEELKKQQRVFYVAVMPDNAPYSYVEKGEVKGILPDIFRLAAERLGINYRFLSITTRKEYQELAGTADILLNLETQYSLAENAGYKLSRQVLELPTAELRLRDAEGTVRKVAVPRHPDLFSRMIDIFSERVEFVEYESVRECVEAVSRRDCDAAYMPFYTAHHWVQIANQGGSLEAMRMTVLPDKRIPFSFGVRSQRDVHLGRLLNLGLGTITNTYIRKLEADYTTFKPGPQTLGAFLRSNPLVVAGIFLVIVLAVFAFMRYRMLLQQAGEEKALLASYADFWTGRHNRHWFERNVLQIAEGYQRAQEEHRLAVGVVSLGWGGVFQDTYGRDALTAAMAQLFDAFAAEKDFVRAIGLTTSAQKLYLLLTVPPEQDMQARLHEMLQKNSYTTLNSTKVSLNLKAGCVYVSLWPFEPGRLTGWAETALASVRGKVEDVAIFDQQQRDLLTQQRLIEQYMEKGIREKEIKLYCQPKYDIATHTCIGAEALTRWQSPELGFLGPGQFVPIFERNGFALTFDFYMLEEACALQRRRLDSGQRVVPISVNQSRLHFTEPDYIAKMRQIAEKYQLPDGIIELEITETLFENFNDPRQVGRCIAIMEEMHRLGFGLSMDDFGSGYSSLTMVARLPLDVLKIDRALLLSAEEGKRRRTVLESTIKLGHDLGMSVICEGIETPAQEKMLLELGCHQGQGYIYAKPMPAEEFEKFLAEVR